MLKQKNLQLNNRVGKYRKTVSVDGLVRRIQKKPVKIQSPKFRAAFIVPFKRAQPSPKKFIALQKLYLQKRVSVLAAALALIIAFGGGMWSVFATSKSSADAQPEVLGAYTDQPSNPAPPSGTAVSGSQLQGQTGGNISSDALFNTPIEYLQNYFANVNEPNVINQRKNQLTEFLNSRNSPLAVAAETIAEQPHWKLILAIAFAESSLGKNCTDFNCSNIGIKPGNPIWHRYASYQDWVVDFNRLLDKRYKDETLQEMCGVYVKPCNPNWLLATQEILDALKAQGIE
jgi:hypothetical protein